jgi:uncharacterized protein YnzC (UPF0291/DUF896 family)
MNSRNNENRKYKIPTIENVASMARLIRKVITPTIKGIYPKKSNHEVISLYDLIVFGILSSLYCDGNIKKAYRQFVLDKKMFPKIKYNKMIERLHRYELLLYRLNCLFKEFMEGNIRNFDSRPIKTKKVIRKNRYNKRGKSKLITEKEKVGYNASKKEYYLGYKLTAKTDGNFIKPIFVDPANRHDITIIKRRFDKFIADSKGEMTIGDKGYISGSKQKEARRQGVMYVAVPRKNMIHHRWERKLYSMLGKMRKSIETIFSLTEDFGLRFIRAITRRGLSIKIQLAILATNFYQLSKLLHNSR